MNEAARDISLVAIKIVAAIGVDIGLLMLVYALYRMNNWPFPPWIRDSKIIRWLNGEDRD